MASRIGHAKFAAISCLHCPFVAMDAIESMLGRFPGPHGDLTDFIILGDLFESSAASVHPDEHGHTLADEDESAAAVLKLIRTNLPKNCRLHFILGNHDDNIQVPDSRRTDWRTRRLIHWNQSEWKDEFRKWKQYPYVKPSVHSQVGCMQLGQVIFTHGFDAGQNSDELEGLQVAYACGGHAHRLVVRGHTHRPKNVFQCKRSAKVLLPYWTCNAGTCGPLQPAYMARKDVSQWGAGVVWGECKINTPSRFSSKEWEARVELL